MARDNGVAVVTVENAYMQLVIEGYAEARPKRGFFVTEGCAGRGPSRGKTGVQADARLSAAGNELRRPDPDPRRMVRLLRLQSVGRYDPQRCASGRLGGDAPVLL